MTTKHIDLRRRLRLTVAEGQFVLDLLDQTDAPARRLREKIAWAVRAATHVCDTGPDGKCKTCREYPAQIERLRKRRAADFKAALARGTPRAKPEPPAPIPFRGGGVAEGGTPSAAVKPDAVEV